MIQSAHNADFFRLRISKMPANAHEMNYFYTLCVGSGKYKWMIGGGMGEKMKKCDFIQKSACILYFAVIIYKPNA